jgi:hypothetical protein
MFSCAASAGQKVFPYPIHLLIAHKILQYSYPFLYLNIIANIRFQMHYELWFINLFTTGLNDVHFSIPISLSKFAPYFPKSERNHNNYRRPGTGKSTNRLIDSKRFLLLS